MTLALLAAAWLLTYLLHSTILLAGGWLLAATGVVRTPAAKDALWKVCLVGGLLTATVQAASQDRFYGRHYWLPNAAQPAQLQAEAAPASVTPVAVSRGGTVRSRSSVRTVARRATLTDASLAWSGAATIDGGPTAARAVRPPSWPITLLAVWMLGAGALLARLAIRRVRFGRRLDGREPVEGNLLETLESLRAAAGVRRRVHLSVSARLSGPVAIGASQICLPERVLTSLTPAEQRAVLAHELGHLVRRDPSWLAFAVLLESLFFLQPLNRFARRRLQESAEYLCDDWAVAQTGGSLTLARCLAEVAGWIQASRYAVPVSGMAENRSHLVERVQRLLDGEPPVVRGVRLALPVAALALATVAFAAPGVLPPCTSDQPSSAAALTAVQRHAPSAAYQGSPHTWATVRDGRLLVFRSGFAPRITGQGRIGIRRGGRAIELMDDQQLTVNGRPVSDDGEVAICDCATVRIVDRHGATVWSLDPVRITPGSWSDESAAAADDQDDAAVATESPDDDGDAVGVKLDGLDAADLATVSSDFARLGAGLSREIRAAIVPQVAQLQNVGVRLATDLAPQLAEMGVRIAAGIGPAVAAAFDSAACDSDAAAKTPAPRLRRGMDGHKRLR